MYAWWILQLEELEGPIVLGQELQDFAQRVQTLGLAPPPGLSHSNDQSEFASPMLAHALESRSAAGDSAIGSEDIGRNFKQVRQELRFDLKELTPDVVQPEPDICIRAMQIERPASLVSGTLSIAETADKEPLSHRPPCVREAHRASS